MKPVMITTHFDTESKYDQLWRERENKAIVDAGFELVTVGSTVFGLKDVEFDYLQNRDVAFRCYANQEHMIDEMLRHVGIKRIVPNVHTANDWYKSLDHDIEFFGRKIGHLDLKRFGYIEEIAQMKSLETSLRGMFDEFERGGEVFVKSTTKSSFIARLRNYPDLLEEITYALGISCHNMPSELIFSNPKHINHIDNLEYDREEYRVFIIDAHPVTTSIFTDTKSDRGYTTIDRFARKFAKRYESKLPRAYCLDIARDVYDGLFVVELNGFAASGFFADHDIDKLFTTLKRVNV